MMDYTDFIDPNNKRTANLRAYVNRIRVVTSGIERLELKRRTSGAKLTDEESFSLASFYCEMGRVAEAAQLMRPLADKVKDAPSLRAVSRIFMDAKMDADAEKVLNRYLKLAPKADATAWTDLAKLQHRAKRKSAAQQSFIQGYKLDAQGIFPLLQKDQELYEIAAPLFRQR